MLFLFLSLPWKWSTRLNKGFHLKCFNHSQTSSFWANDEIFWCTKNHLTLWSYKHISNSLKLPWTPRSLPSVIVIHSVAHEISWLVSEWAFTYRDLIHKSLKYSVGHNSVETRSFFNISSFLFWLSIVSSNKCILFCQLTYGQPCHIISAVLSHNRDLYRHLF